MINSGFFLKPSSLRKVDRRRFCGETEGVLLSLARKPRQTEPAAKAAGEPKVNSPSVSAKKHRRASSDVTTSRIAQIRRDLIWLPGRLTEGAFKGKVKRKVKQLFIFYTLKAKPLFIASHRIYKSAFISWQSKRGFALSNLICPSIV